VSQINQGNTGFASGTDYSVNGARLRSNNFTLDGQDVNEPGLAGTGIRFNNPDAIQEFRMITNQFSAEYGRASGSVIAVATKSGTNSFHGSASWYHNSNPLNSLSNVDKAAGITEAPWRIENQFGGTLGGPIVRDKTFFFGSLQRWTDRQLGAGSTISSAPTAEGRSILQANGGSSVTTGALLSHLPTAEGAQTGVVRYCFNPAPWTGPGAPPAVTASGSGFICAFPSAATQPVTGWTVNTIPVGSLTSSNIITKNVWQWSARGDHTFNPTHSLNMRYLYSTQVEEGTGQATPKGLADVSPLGTHAATIGLTSTLGGNFLNEVRGSFSRFITATDPQDPSSLSIPSIEVADLGLNGFNAVATRTGIGYGVNLPQSRRNNIYQVVDNMTWIHGGHTMKFGVDFRRTQISSNFNPNVRGQLRYSTLTNLVADFADLTAQINKPLPGGQLLIDYNWDDWFFFVQNDWKVTPNFTLNLGLRYELPGDAIESLYPLNDRIVTSNSGNTLFRYNSRPPRDTNNFMPRFGFNWNLGDSMGPLNNLVVRGGYTRSFDYIFLNMALNITSAFPFTAAFSNPSTPNSMASFPGLALSLERAPLLNQTIVAQDFRAPYSDQYSLEIQKELGTNNVFRVGYVGTKGTALFQSQEANPTTRCGASTCPRIDPTRGVIRQRANTGSSIYHSLQTGLDRRLTRGVSGGVHYTWSSFIDNGSEVFNASTAEVATPQDPFNRNAGERARSTYDRPHRLTGNVVYELPFMRDQAGAAGKIAGGWQIGTIMTFQSGSPFTVLNGSDPGGVLLGSLVGNAIRPNFAPGVDVDALRKMTLPEIREQVLASGTPAAFFRALATNGGPTVANPTGNVSRNFLRADGLVSIDMNIVKNIKVAEVRNIQIRADFFNLPNHRNFGIPNATASATAFNFLNEGAVDGGNRRIFFALRYTF
jgi:hypothetical protein